MVYEFSAANLAIASVAALGSPPPAASAAPPAAATALPVDVTATAARRELPA
jgi:hypothetical protein